MLESRKISRKQFDDSTFEEKLVTVNRVTKVVQGGRIFSFAALVVVGDKSGYFGIGLGKAGEIVDARRKALQNAKNNLFYIFLKNNRTIPHEVEGSFGSGRVIIKPAKPGRGIIAGGAMRLIFECLGIKDVVAKSVGSTNPHNVTKATVNALLKVRSPKFIAYLRDKKVRELYGKSDAEAANLEKGE